MVFSSERFAGVEHVQNEFRAPDAFVTAADAFGLNAVSGFAQASGVNEHHGQAADVRGFFNGIARGAGARHHDGAIVPEQLIE